MAEKLVKEVYDNLGADQQSAMQALAVYNYPVPEEAVAALYPSLADAEDVLDSLAKCFSVTYRDDHDTYELHPLDHHYAYAQIPEEGENGRRELDRRAAGWWLSRSAEVESSQGSELIEDWALDALNRWADYVGRATWHLMNAEAWQDLVGNHAREQKYYVRKFNWGYITECRQLAPKMIEAARIVRIKTARGRMAARMGGPQQ